MSITFLHVKDNKNMENVMIENIIETNYEYKDEKPLRHSQYGKIKYLQQTLNSINNFLLLLMMSYVVSHIKLISMYWCESMRPLRTNLRLVMQEIFFSLHYSFPGSDSSSNNFMLNEMIKYICFYHFNTNHHKFLYLYILKYYVWS